MKYPLDQKGLTLVELVVTVSVISILILAMGMSMEGWQDRYRVESKSHDMFTDITEARAGALHEGRAYFVVFPPAPNDDSYSVFRDRNGNGILEPAADAEPDGDPWREGEFFGYKLIPETVAMRGIRLNSRGMVDQTGYVRVVDKKTGLALEDAEYDCLEFRATRIKPGRWNKPNAGKCNAR